MKEKIILASNSARRAEIFKMLNLDFKIVASDCEEKTDATSPEDIVMTLSNKKALDVFSRTGGIVVAADTIVYIDGEVLGKPADLGDAVSMISKLSGRAHEVYTGICIMTKDKTITDYCITDVHFKELRPTQIGRYVSSGEPLDKAGAYGISGLGSALVEKIEGDFFNVVGFPVSLFVTIMDEEFGLDVI